MRPDLRDFTPAGPFDGCEVLRPGGCREVPASFSAPEERLESACC